MASATPDLVTFPAAELLGDRGSWVWTAARDVTWWRPDRESTTTV